MSNGATVPETSGSKLLSTVTEEYSYTYQGCKLTQQTLTTTTETDRETTTTTETLYFTYDASGNPMSLTYTDASGAASTYYYTVNVQGDVIAILDTDGTAVVEYAYDAWGDPLATTGTMADTLGTATPLRYRGYTYEAESNLYYLQSRLYNPDLRRFISPDAFTSTGQGILGNNMFAYCLNNPVNCADPSGESPVALIIMLALITVTVSGCSFKSSEVGAASPYIPSNSTEYNCYAYALGETQWKYVGGSSNAVEDYDIDLVAEMVLADAEKDGRSIKPIDSYNSPIESNEYRIALRTGESDYHFMVQHCDGSWSHKPGVCSTRLIEGPNPSVVSWDAPLLDPYLLSRGIILEIGTLENYYDSKTIYFAVSR